VPEKPPPLPPGTDGQNNRQQVQAALGQVQGVVHRVVEDADWWLPLTGPADPALTAADLRAAYLEAGPQFGAGHASLNTGAHDEALHLVGFSGAQLAAKMKGLLSATQRYATAKTSNAREYLKRMRAALTWSGTIVASVSVAIQKETDKIPGASAALEGVKEFIEVLRNASEEADATPSVTGEVQPDGPARKSRP